MIYLRRLFLSSLLGVLLTLGLNVSFAKAARIILQPHDSLGRQIDISLDTEGINLNAIQGEIAIQGDVNNVHVLNANSIVPIWVVAPIFEDGSIHFSGIIPGGFEGLLIPNTAGTSPALLFSVIFDPLREERVGVVARNGSVFLNDGLGTQVSLPLAHVDFNSTPATKPASASSSDTYAPSTFTPVIGQDPSIMNGRWFATWNTVDRVSGIDHYEVREYRPGQNVAWVRAESPYELKDQELKSNFDVRAIDRNGNERIGHLDATYPLELKDRISLKGIMYVLVIVSSIFIIAWIKLRKNP